jgi:hypothetical protein
LGLYISFCVNISSEFYCQLFFHKNSTFLIWSTTLDPVFFANSTQKAFLEEASKTYYKYKQNYSTRVHVLMREIFYLKVIILRF